MSCPASRYTGTGFAPFLSIMVGFALNSHRSRRWDLLSFLPLVLSYAQLLGAPANDNFTNRTVITGSTITFNGTLAGASLEAAENGPPFNSSSGGSVWYSWTAPASTRVVVELVRDYTNFSSSNTTFAAYTGADITALTFVDGNNFDWPSGRYAAFAATAGTSYQFRVAGGWGGPFSLKLTAADPPVFLKQPADCVVSPMSSALFTSLAAGPRPATLSKNPVSYQWLSNGIPIPFETGASLLVHGATTNKIAQYSVIASNDGGTATSAVATLAFIDTNATPQLTVLPPSTPGQMSLLLDGQVGRWYRIESSQDLRNWPSRTHFPITNMIWLQLTNRTLSVSLLRLAPIHYARATLELHVDTCVGQLKQLTWARQLAAIDNNNLLDSGPFSFGDLKPYLPPGQCGGSLFCPDFGSYSMSGSIMNPVTCTISSQGHVVDP
jgi:hypothetical protein